MLVEVVGGVQEGGPTRGKVCGAAPPQPTSGIDRRLEYLERWNEPCVLLCDSAHDFYLYMRVLTIPVVCGRRGG